MPNYLEKYKLFLWIADLRVIYAIVQKKLQIISIDCKSQRNICQIVQKKITNYFYGLQISEKYITNWSQM
jgi:hypothetical protein